ncbi:MAG: virulence RhuM family protein [Leptospirales bacterium]
MKDVVIYRTERGSIDVTVSNDNVWLTQDQISELFGRERSVITKHLRNLFNERELDEKCNVQNLHIAGSDKPVRFYNLDGIISVGYRVKSREGVQFRQWASGILKQHLLLGYTLNQKRFEDNARELEKALVLIQKTAENSALSSDSGKGLVDVVTRYTRTFLWLQRYDEGLLTEPSGQEGGILPTPEEARQSIALLRMNLINRGEAGNLFGQERGDVCIGS